MGSVNPISARAWIVGVTLLTGACGGSPPEPGPTPPPESPPAQFDAWQNAQERGIDFRAVGQAPEWYVEVDHEKGIRLVYDNAQQKAIMPSPVQPTTRDGTLMYEGASDTNRVEVAIEAASCTDATGATHPRTVTVNVNGRALRGCGRPLP
jgi:uncharacterized membrane protein